MRWRWQIPHLSPPVRVVRARPSSLDTRLRWVEVFHLTLHLLLHMISVCSACARIP